MSKRKLQAILVLITVSVSVFAKGSAEGGFTVKSGVLSVGQEIGYPPFEYYAEDGRTPIGFDVEMAAALAAKLGLTVRFIDTAWDGIFAGVTKGDYDCIISAATWTPERAAAHTFTKPYIGNAQCIVVLKGNKLGIKDIADLNGRSTSYQGETTSDIYLAGYVAKTGAKITTYEYEKVMSCFDELKLGRVDTVLCDSTVAADYIRDDDTPYEVVWQGPADEVFSICLKKGNTVLKHAMDKALDELFADGTIQSLSQKYFGQDIVSEAHKKVL
jgi:polar amino acid transport system substrate-binding protein